MRNPERKVPPRPPQRISSLEKEKRESIITVIHLNGSASSREDIPGSSRSVSQSSGDSSRTSSSQDSDISKTDSGRDTLSSTVNRTEAEGQKDEFRSKTAINTIPSMCAITPPLSDEERCGGSLQLEKPLAAVETKLQQNNPPKPTAIRSAGVRQPGDGAVAPPSATTVVTRNKDRSKPNLILMSQKRASAGELNPSLKERLPEVASKPKHYVEPYTLDKSVGERRAEIQSIFKDKIVVGADPQKIARSQSQDNRDHKVEAASQSDEEESRSETRSQSHQNESRSQSHQTQSRPRSNQTEPRPQSNQTEPRPQSNQTEPHSQYHLNDDRYHSDAASNAIARPTRSAAQSDASRNSGSRSPHQKQTKMVDVRTQPRHKELSNLVAYKQLPAMSPNTPFSAVPPALKKNNLSHPTNSLDRKTATKMTAHVSLDGNGKVVYSSDSLPRRKGHASFEPGPYVKPPPISRPDATAPLKGKTVGHSSIQNMPLPPVPSEIAITLPKSTTTQPQFTSTAQPKTTNQQQITTVSHTLSGLSSQLQPRTVSEINALRNIKSNPLKSDIDDTSKPSYFSDSEDSSVQQRIQQQLKLRMDARNEPVNPSLQNATYQYKKNDERCHTLPNPKHGQEQKLSYQSLSYQQQLIKQAYQQQQQLQQLQEEQQLRKQQNNVQSQTLPTTAKEVSFAKQPLIAGLAKIPETTYLTRQDIQQSVYQSQNELLRQQASMTDGSRLKNESQAILMPQSTPMGPLGLNQSQMDPSLALAQQQMQVAQAASLGEHAVMHTRQQSALYHMGVAARAQTPIQGTSSPHRLPNSSNSLQYSLRSQTGAIYASQRNMPGGSFQTDRRGTPIPHAMTTSPPPYDQYNVTNSDIYGRIGMTRQVYVGGTLPTAFNRNHRAYSSLPPNLRHPVLSAETLQRVNQNVERALARRSSVLGTETAAQPELPPTEKVSDKKNNKKEKKKKENKTDKPKKKWFWTLPLRRKNKEQECEDDDGGFKDTAQKETRKVLPQEDTSFIRYPSPDTGSTDMNSSYSSDASDHYRTPAESLYYQKSQLAQLQQHRNIIDNTINSSHMTPVPPPISSIPRSHSSTTVSHQEPQTSNTATMTNDSDMTDLTRSRRYMSRDELYAAMRHPQYYNNNRNSLPPEQTLSNVPSSSRSNSPAVFGMTPPSYVIRPQVRENFSDNVNAHRIMQEKAQVAHRGVMENYDSKKTFQLEEVAAPSGYGEVSHVQGMVQQESIVQPVKPAVKQTSITDFKKMILEKSMIAAGSRERKSAVEMLRASRPSIYGYSPPPAPEVVKPAGVAPATPRGHGIIMPPDQRNTARALLFQSRFGSGGRYRAPKTDIISTTIVEDKMQEDIEEEESEDEELTSGSSPERSSVVSVKCSKKMPIFSSENTKKEMDHSTPLKDTESSLTVPNLSIILPPSSADNTRIDDSSETSL